MVEIDLRARTKRLKTLAYIPTEIAMGTSSLPIRLKLTEAATRLLDGLTGGQSAGLISDHRALLTTIAVGRAAEGLLLEDTLVIDEPDIRRVLDRAREAQS